MHWILARLARFRNQLGGMRTWRQLIISLAIVGIFTSSAAAQSRPLRLELPPGVTLQQPTVSAALHPAAKGAIIGAASGAGAFGTLALWYCTIGPNEVGECGPHFWTPGVFVYAAIGAGIGALIGAIAGR